MSALARALSAEALKLRRTLALWMCAIAPAVVAGMMVLQLVARELKPSPMSGEQVWQAFGANVYGLWIVLMLPLFVTLQSALLAGLEHGNQQWKHLLALPLPRPAHYAAKWLVLVAMTAAAFALLVLLTALGGGVLMVAKPVFGLAGAPPWAYLAKTGAIGFVASLPMLALQGWIALRFRSFTIAVAAGMSATVGGFLIVQSSDWAPRYPWTMPIQALASPENADPVRAVTVGLVLGLALAVLAIVHLARRDAA
ncbi:ABC transporter permease [Arenimonas composti]|uniref:ABC transporter permease n=1 Tax=Arenimonas composti TR7-09 = DSM 18010 TaxID=1121013 RepID=A0A091BGU2_9GAMM|nr:ABC transporter permease [Arenimonas composti]KFN50777.1 hypothetical protein P873_05145 [Arenimonas composti TR7-09 = DSM 18010]